jgi:integral membrane protein
VVTPERALRPVAAAEAISFVVLLGFAVGRAAGGPDLSATLGPIHGIVFCGYVVVVLQARPRLGWSATRTILTLLAAVVPLGGAVVAHRAGEQSGQEMAG